MCGLVALLTAGSIVGLAAKGAWPWPLYAMAFAIALASALVFRPGSPRFFAVGLLTGCTAVLFVLMISIG